MKKIPGTLYQIDISQEKENKFNLIVNHRNEVVLDKKGIEEKETIIDAIIEMLESDELSIPRNRIELIVKQELKNITPIKGPTFYESTVSKMVDHIQKETKREWKKIILMGLSNAGKTCIYERVFEGKKPWELTKSVATKGISYKEYEVGSLTKPMIWDLGGQKQYLDQYHGNLKTNIFQKGAILLYVIDVSDPDRFEESKMELTWATNQLMSSNPNARIHIFFHKIDSIHDREALLQYLDSHFIKDLGIPVKTHLTSIFDESLFKAWSDIIQEISPKSTFINTILEQLKINGDLREVLLIDKNTGLACGSTLQYNEEDVIIGMVSLLIITIDKVTNELKLNKFKEFSLKTEESLVLLTDITKDLLLVNIIKESNVSDEKMKKLSELVEGVSEQIMNLWDE